MKYRDYNEAVQVTIKDPVMAVEYLIAAYKAGSEYSDSKILDKAFNNVLIVHGKENTKKLMRKPT